MCSTTFVAFTVENSTIVLSNYLVCAIGSIIEYRRDTVTVLGFDFLRNLGSLYTGVLITVLCYENFLILINLKILSVLRLSSDCHSFVEFFAIAFVLTNL